MDFSEEHLSAVFFTNVGKITGCWMCGMWDVGCGMWETNPPFLNPIIK